MQNDSHNPKNLKTKNHNMYSKDDLNSFMIKNNEHHIYKPKNLNNHNKSNRIHNPKNNKHDRSDMQKSKRNISHDPTYRYDKNLQNTWNNNNIYHFNNANSYGCNNNCQNVHKKNNIHGPNNSDSYGYKNFHQNIQQNNPYSIEEQNFHENNSHNNNHNNTINNNNNCSNMPTGNHLNNNIPQNKSLYKDNNNQSNIYNHNNEQNINPFIQKNDQNRHSKKDKYNFLYNDNDVPRTHIHIKNDTSHYYDDNESIDTRGYMANNFNNKYFLQSNQGLTKTCNFQQNSNNQETLDSILKSINADFDNLKEKEYSRWSDNGKQEYKHKNLEKNNLDGNEDEDIDHNNDNDSFSPYDNWIKRRQNKFKRKKHKKIIDNDEKYIYDKANFDRKFHKTFEKISNKYKRNKNNYEKNLKEDSNKLDQYYKELGVNKNATEKEIKKAHKKLVLKYHPDRGGDKDKFQKIQKAYEILIKKD